MARLPILVTVSQSSIVAVGVQFELCGSCMRKVEVVVFDRGIERYKSLEMLLIAVEL